MTEQRWIGVQMSGKVGIVLINYNGEKYIADCLNSLQAQTYNNFEILFWDNHSSDASIEIVKRLYTQVHLVESQYNYGFAKANNLAVKQMLKMGAEYILLLNVDTVADSFLVERLLEKADANTVTTARIGMGKNGGANWYAGGELQFDIGNARHLYIKNYKKETPVSFISGCCMMIHKDIIKKYGLFNAEYYLYYEDTDLCMRWYLEGVRMLYIPSVKVWHKVGGSTGGYKSPLKEYYLIRNRLYFVNRYRKYIKANTKDVLCNIIKNKIVWPTEYNGKMIRAACYGILDYYMGKMGKIDHKL